MGSELKVLLILAAVVVASIGMVGLSMAIGWAFTVGKLRAFKQLCKRSK